MLLAATPPDWQLVVDDSTAAASPRDPGSGSMAIAITWRMVVQGRALPLMSGLSFYRLDSQRRICYVKESAEQLVKVPTPLAPLLGGAAPLLQLLAAPAATTPAAGGNGASSRVQGGAQGAAAQRTSRQASAPLQASNGSVRGGNGGSWGAVNGTSSSSMAAAGAGQQGPTPSPPRPASSGSSASSLGRLEGVWLKDFAASDIASYERALKLMQIGGLQRTTAMQVREGHGASWC
jgi:hypothetical protein